MGSDIHSVRITTSGSIAAGRRRLRAVYIASGDTVGSVQIRNENGSGVVLCRLDTPADATAVAYVELPDRGILFPDGIYATVTNLAGVTVFYE